MRLIQFLNTDNQRQVGVVDEDGKSITPLRDIERVYDLALVADRIGSDLATLVSGMMADETVDYDAIVNENRLLLPLDHPDPAHCILSGTGLDHLGSAQARDSMHAKLDSVDEELTDSMKMFKLGLEGGKPAKGEIGSQPEWFYKGDGDWLARPGQPLQMPSFALDGGEEPELVGLYVIGDAGNVLRVGFALGNEFSDHVLEKQNYLYLAHSKLRASSFGPELLLGDPPADIRGTSRLLRKQKARGDADGKEKKVWAGDFLTGEENMTHTLANIEHHHFKYPGFRRPGDVHCHYYGTATLSFVDGISAKPGDVFEISSPNFGRPLRNPLELVEMGVGPVSVRSL